MELAQRDTYLRNLQEQLEAIHVQRNEIISDLENSKEDNLLLKDVLNNIKKGKEIERSEKDEQIQHMKDLIRYLDRYIKMGNLSNSVLTNARLQKKILQEHIKYLE